MCLLWHPSILLQPFHFCAVLNTTRDPQATECSVEFKVWLPRKHAAASTRQQSGFLACSVKRQISPPSHKRQIFDVVCSPFNFGPTKKLRKKKSTAIFHYTIKNQTNKFVYACWATSNAIKSYDPLSIMVIIIWTQIVWSVAMGKCRL